MFSKCKCHFCNFLKKYFPKIRILQTKSYTATGNCHTIITETIGGFRGEAGGEANPPPRSLKHFCINMALLWTSLFLVTNFPKIVISSIFILNFHDKFQDFLKISSRFVLDVQTREKLTHGLLNIF